MRPVGVRGHAVRAEHRELECHDPVHRQGGSTGAGGQQADLHVTAAPAQALDRRGAGGLAAERVEGHVRAAVREIPDGGTDVGDRATASTVATAPSRVAERQGPPGETSTATTRAPRAVAIITADRPTPPHPCTATQSPTLTPP